MGNMIDRVGQKFNRLIIQSQYYKNNKTRAICKCNCGVIKDINLYSVTSGNTKSCGCHRIENTRKIGLVKGSKYKIAHKIFYNIWRGMIQRCTNPEMNNYKYYGGRGITVCDKWLDYDNFIDDMYDSYSKGLTIERVNVNGNYQPSNCCWVTKADQNRNQRKTIFITYNGQTKPRETWAKEYGLYGSTVKDRLSRGMSIHDALNTPSRTKQYRSK